MKLQYCGTCILPNTRPNLAFDSDGKCNCPRGSNRREIDWKSREADFISLVRDVKNRRRDYDCVIPVSGGKDSTWQVLTALKYELKPLCVTWRTPGRTQVGAANLANLISLGVTHFDLTLDQAVERMLTRHAFEKRGIPALPMHLALHAMPLIIALRFEIPLVLWGENSAYEYGGDTAQKGAQMDYQWYKKFGVNDGTSGSDWRNKNISQSQLFWYTRPSDKELRDANVTSHFLGHYFEWDPLEVYRMAQVAGFRSALKPEVGLYEFADIDEGFLMAVHHWIKWYKFGFSRLWDNLSIEIRKGRISRDEALRIVSDSGQETPTEAIQDFAEYIDLPLDKTYQIAESFRNREIWQQDENGVWHIPGFLIPGWKW